MRTGGTFFHAPWSTTLKVVTGLAAAVLAGVGGLVATVLPRDLLAGVPLALTMAFVATTLLGSALFVVRGYEVSSGQLLVRRLLWSTGVPLSGLREAQADPKAMPGSVRLFGNGGLFVFAGLFWNRKLGTYRAFATDPGNAVVLRLERRAVVVTPDHPGPFLDAVARACPQATVRRSGP